METEKRTKEGLFGVSLQPEGLAGFSVSQTSQIYLEGKPARYEKALKLARKKAMKLREHSPKDGNLKPEELLVELSDKENVWIYRGSKPPMPFRC